MIFKQANSIFTEPYFAKLPRKQLPSRYVVALAVALAIGLAIIGRDTAVPFCTTLVARSAVSGT